MPVVFSAANTLNPDPRIRAANAYQAVLDYAAGHLSGADYTTLLGQLTTAGLPTDSSDVLDLPNPFEYTAGVLATVLAYVAAFPININPISATSPVFGGSVAVDGDLDVGNDADVTGSLTVDGNLTITGLLSALTGLVSIENDVAVTGDVVSGGGLRVGSLVPAPNVGEVIADNIQADHFVFSGAVDPLTAAPGTLAEDANGDVFFIPLGGGRVVYLSRPSHDTGWLEVGGTLHASLGVAGSTAPTPTLVPDIYGATPLTLAAAPGDPGGPTRMVIWIRADQTLVVGGGGSGDYFIEVGPFESGGNLAGVAALVDTNLQLAITLGNPLVPAQPGIVVGAGAGLVAVRIMIWIR